MNFTLILEGIAVLGIMGAVVGARVFKPLCER